MLWDFNPINLRKVNVIQPTIILLQKDMDSDIRNIKQFFYEIKFLLIIISYKKFNPSKEKFGTSWESFIIKHKIPRFLE
jgi:hypothetical protein